VGKLAIASPESAAALVAAAIPEARVIPLQEADDGGVSCDALAKLEPLAQRVDAVLAGPGMSGGETTLRFLHDLMPLFGRPTLILDALAMDSVRRLGRFDRPVLMTPHAGEMAHLTGERKEDIRADPLSIAGRYAKAWNAVIALKGVQTCIATPDGRLWHHSGAVPGLAASGSGDVLAGVVAALAARGASLEQAAAWGVTLHARAGRQLERRLGTVGYLARELAAEIPGLLDKISTPSTEA